MQTGTCAGQVDSRYRARAILTRQSRHGIRIQTVTSSSTACRVHFAILAALYGWAVDAGCRQAWKKGNWYGSEPWSKSRSRARRPVRLAVHIDRRLGMACATQGEPALRLRGVPRSSRISRISSSTSSWSSARQPRRYPPSSGRATAASGPGSHRLATGEGGGANAGYWADGAMALSSTATARPPFRRWFIGSPWM